MAYGYEEKQKFIELRGRGWSFEAIAKETGISKPTLIKWNGELLQEVKEAQYFELENTIQKYELMRGARFEVYCKVLKEAMKELEDRVINSSDFETVPTDKLLSMIEKLEERINKDTFRELLKVPAPDDIALFEKYIEVY